MDKSKISHTFALGFSKTPFPTINSPALKTLAESFKRNIMRLKVMMLAPALVGDLANRLQRFTDIAELEITGTVENARATTGDKGNEIFERTKILLRADTELFVNATAQPDELDAMIGDVLETGSTAVVLLSAAGGQGALAFEALFFSYVVSMWTIFETVAGDLWEEALNAHPHGLSSLKGSKNEFIESIKSLKQQRSDTDRRQPPDQSISLSQVERHGFDLRGKMGSALRGDQRFDSLGGIRQAYGRAFYEKHDKIRDAICDKSLDALGSVRNLIVHRSGIADQTYLDQIQFLAIPKLGYGEEFVPDGETVAKLIKPALETSIKLFQEIDAWITTN